MSKQSEETDLEMYFLTKAPIEDLTRDQLRTRWAYLKTERDALEREIITIRDVLVAGNQSLWIQKKIGQYIINKNSYL